MSNEQLAILLRSIADRLDAALLNARDQIAGAREPHMERVHTDPRCIGLFCQNGDHFSDQPMPDPVEELEEIDALLTWLAASADSLSPTP